MIDKQYLISVIIPCYNVADYVEQAVRSIQNQTYQNLEIWIIDDASTDNTLERVQGIKDDRILIKAFTENTQKVGAVNEVLQMVKGDFIAFQDADDWAEPDRLALQLNAFLEDNELGICFTNYTYTGKKNVFPGRIALTDKELKDEFLNYNYKREPGTSPTNCPSMMISRAAFEKTGGYHPYFRGRVAEDVQWIYRILKYFKGGTVEKRLYHYRLRQGSFTQIQSSGIRPKYAYSWQLVSKIIYKDIHEGVDVLLPDNIDILKCLELEACEKALSEKIQLLENIKLTYENSTNYKLGKLILKPVRFIKSFFEK